MLLLLFIKPFALIADAPDDGLCPFALAIVLAVAVALALRPLIFFMVGSLK